MRFHKVRWLFAALVLVTLAAPAAAQQLATPPAPLWRVEANGDAVQTDLGFIMPARIGAFERKGFTSTRSDGRSTMTWYEDPNGLSLRILIHLRVDVRGFPMEGRVGDPLDLNWSFLQNIGSNAPEGQRIVHQRIGWNGGPHTNAIMQLDRFPGPQGAEFQGMWYRNIGVWAVLAVASGPEARRTEIEVAGRAAMALPWPGAPRGAELIARARGFLAELQDCGTIDRSGNGSPVEINSAVGAAMAFFLAPNFIENPAETYLHPASTPGDYCRIETFTAAPHEIVALAWRGDRSGDRAARYAFMVRDGSSFVQFETNLPARAASPQLEPLGISRAVQLTFYNQRNVAVTQVFTDWPSYEDAKQAATRVLLDGQIPVILGRRTPQMIQVSVNHGRVIDPPAGTTPSAAAKGN